MPQPKRLNHAFTNAVGTPLSSSLPSSLSPGECCRTRAICRRDAAPAAVAITRCAQRSWLWQSKSADAPSNATLWPLTDSSPSPRSRARRAGLSCRRTSATTGPPPAGSRPLPRSLPGSATVYLPSIGLGQRLTKKEERFPIRSHRKAPHKNQLRQRRVGSRLGMRAPDAIQRS
jgi:hypothetical protein